MIDENSRYAMIEKKMVTGYRGSSVVIIGRRFLPQMNRIHIFKTRTIKMEDRLDTIAYEETGDPKRFWIIADANSEMNPSKLTEKIGSQISIAQAMIDTQI